MIRLRLDRSTGAPLTDQIVNQIRQKILAGELSPRARLPLLKELQTSLGVGLGTVRSALPARAG